MKRLRFKNGVLDPIDSALIRELAADARVSHAELARRVGLSPPSAAERVRRLEEAGVIRGYVAEIDPSALGRPLCAYLRIRPIPGRLPKVAKLLRELDAVVECDRITGEDCFIAKAHVESVEALETLIDALMPHAMTNTSIVQSSPVERRLPPLPAAGGRPRQAAAAQKDRMAATR